MKTCCCAKVIWPIIILAIMLPIASCSGESPRRYVTAMPGESAVLLVATEAPSTSPAPPTATMTASAVPTEAAAKCDLEPQLGMPASILTINDVYAADAALQAGARWRIESDITTELKEAGLCARDCAKRIWTPGRVIITLVRYDTVDAAKHAAENTRLEFHKYTEEIMDRSLALIFPGNAWCGYYSPQRNFILVYAYGEMLVYVTSQPPQSPPDFPEETALIIRLGKLQQEKLCQNGHSPR